VVAIAEVVFLGLGFAAHARNRRRTAGA
jgi:hypothetical protein